MKRSLLLSASCVIVAPTVTGTYKDLQKDYAYLGKKGGSLGDQTLTEFTSFSMDDESSNGESEYEVDNDSFQFDHTTTSIPSPTPDTDKSDPIFGFEGSNPIDSNTGDGNLGLTYYFSNVDQLCHETEANTTNVTYMNREKCCEDNVNSYADYNCKNNIAIEPCYKKDDENITCVKLDNPSVCHYLNNQSTNAYRDSNLSFNYQIYSNEKVCCSYYPTLCGKKMDKCYQRLLSNQYLCEEESNCVQYQYNTPEIHDTFDECCNETSWPFAACVNANHTKEEWYENNRSCYKPENYECTKETVYENCWKDKIMYPTSLDACLQQVETICQKVVNQNSDTGFKYCSDQNKNCVENSTRTGIECIDPCKDVNITYALPERTIYYPNEPTWPLRKCNETDPCGNCNTTENNCTIGNVIDNYYYNTSCSPLV